MMLPPNPSVIRVKGKGEKGSPWWMPWEGRKGREGEPLMRIEKKTKEISVINQLTQEEWNPKASKIALIYFQLSLSKALDMSILISIHAVLVDFREWTASLARMILSRI